MFIPQRSVRDSRYKLLLHLLPGEGQAPLELFDLEKDPGETKNLVSDPACLETRDRLQAALQGWRQETADPLLNPAVTERWNQARERWAKLPRVPAKPLPVVRLPAGESDVLYAP